VVVHGDGTSQWTLTHADDFAVAFVGLLGHPAAIGDDFTITGTHAPTWNEIYTWLGRAAGVEPDLVHVASDTIAAVAPDLGPGLVGDKAHSMVFDCSKVSALVPEFATTISYHDAVHDQIAWYDAHPDACVIDTELDAVFDRLVRGARSF
jgi:nucleoside-diphosphate-sugar epimerase